MKAEVGLEAEATVPPAPEMMVHKPVPCVGAFAAKVAVPPQTIWSSPALDVVVAGVTMIVPLAFTAPQPPVKGML